MTRPFPTDRHPLNRFDPTYETADRTTRQLLSKFERYGFDALRRQNSTSIDQLISFDDIIEALVRAGHERQNTEPRRLTHVKTSDDLPDYVDIRLLNKFQLKVVRDGDVIRSHQVSLRRARFESESEELAQEAHYLLGFDGRVSAFTTRRGKP